MIFRKKINPKIISTSIIISIMVPSVLFFSPQKAGAIVSTSGYIIDSFAPLIYSTETVNTIQTTTQTGIQLKEIAKEVFREVLKNLAKRTLNKMTESTINWVNTGYSGRPLFLENPESFFKDIAKYEVKNFVDTIGYDSLRLPFGKDLALNTIYTYKRQFEENAQYSLSKVTNDQDYLNSFRNDFSVGGWDGFLLNTQYPQNNPIGFRMLATEELARRLEGTSQNAAQTINTKLEQGAGFLSPQTCPSNPKYDTLKNQFQQPKFKSTLEYLPETRPEGQTEEEYYIQFNKMVSAEQTEWEKKNGCPGGLFDTTPGSVVGNQIANALTTGQRQGELAVAMGNSVSAILDAMLNQLLNKGLNALATTESPNPPPLPDDWEYFGNTLGTTEAYNSTTWNSGPDEVIVLSQFKQEVERDIMNTEIDIALLSQLGAELTKTWQQIRQLDQCVPGPDIKWDDRLEEEKQRNASKLLEKSGDDDLNEASRAREAMRELNYAVTFFKDWIQSRMLEALPNSPVYIDTIQSIDSLYQQSTEIVEARRRRTAALARLKSIQLKLASYSVEPAPGTPEETTLITYKKEYNATKINSSNSLSIEDTRDQLNTAKDNLKDIARMTDQCKTERTEKGWGPVDINGNGISTGIDSSGRTGTEKQLFCDYPIVGGFSYGDVVKGVRIPTTYYMFINPVDPPQYGPDGTEGSLPMVNANNVFTYDKAFGNGEVNIKIKCNILFRANVLDYKGNIPGVTPIAEKAAPPVGPEDEEGGNSSTAGGQCADTGNQYAGELRQAMDVVLAANPSVANLPNIESGGRQNARTFLALVESELISMGLNATDEVLNGNNNPSTGDIIAVWDNGDTMMERYDAINGGASTIGTAAQTNFEGFIPLNCTSSGGGNNCGCQTITTPGGSGTSPSPLPNPTPVPSTSGTPGITSVSPTAVIGGQTTLTINGKNLTSTVRFFDSLGTRSTVVGTVNTARTQTTVLVPAGLIIGSGSLDVYASSNSISNKAFVNYVTSSAGSGGGTLSTATPTSTWNPTQTGNGWWPRLSPNGRYVAYGDWPESWVTDLQTGQNYNLGTPADLANDPSHSCLAGEWITPTKLTYVCSSANIPGDQLYRYEVTIGQWTPTRTTDNVGLVANSQFVARDGHWASWIANTSFRLAKDNQLVATGVGGTMDLSGNLLINACDNSNSRLCLRTGTTLTKTIAVLAPLSQAAITDGYIIYGGYGPIRGVTPSGIDTNLRLSNSYNEGAGRSSGIRNGSSAQILLVNGSYWVASSASGAGGNYIFLRPWGSTTAIVVSAEAASLDVKVVGSNFIIAYNNDRGGAAVITVPVNSPRVSIP
ncbi:MAG TPA: hypothetical protein VJC14_03415 [Candidatus Paceibacterota bacterium]